MLWANTPEGKTAAAPGASGTCPACGAELIPKCGEIVAWHWAHRSKDCDPWSEPESEWHLGWKQRFPADWQEQVIGPHRADVLTPRGVVEFQRSAISSAEIREREAFYGRMVWVLDAAEFNLEPALHWHHRRFEKTRPHPSGGDLFSLLDQDRKRVFEQWWADRTAHAKAAQERNPCFRWLWPRKSWFAAQKTLLLDLGGESLALVKRIYQGDGPTHIACSAMSKAEFVARCSRPPGPSAVAA